MRPALLALPLALAAAGTALAQTPPVCVQDDSVKERFLPVELLTGNPITGSQELAFAPVDRVYPFIDELPGGGLGQGEAALKGPLKWEGAAGVTYEIYERKVPRAHERFALTPDRTAIGRVYDERIGNIANEGKFPVGLWKQGQKRSYNTTYHMASGMRQGTTAVEIEKLSCSYDGVAGAVQYGWTTGTGQSYGYIYVPGRGLVHVMTRSQGRR